MVIVFGAFVCANGYDDASAEDTQAGASEPVPRAARAVSFEKFIEPYTDRFYITNGLLDEDITSKEYSPNNTYWYCVFTPGPLNAECQLDGMVFIYTGKDQSLRITFRQYDEGVSLRWINEKLLYCEVWFSKSLGSYMIVDVENEKMLIREMIRKGGRAPDERRLVR